MTGDILKTKVKLFVYIHQGNQELRKPENIHTGNAENSESVIKINFLLIS